jgi:hypothetical protein
VKHLKRALDDENATVRENSEKALKSIMGEPI